MKAIAATALAWAALATGVVFALTAALQYLDSGAYQAFFGPRDPGHDRIVIAAVHIGGGVGALLTAMMQHLLGRHRGELHRIVGRLYVLSVAMSGLAGAIMASYALGGLLNTMGFLLLSVLWMLSTWLGWNSARRRAIARHREWMARSFALTLAGATLRVELLVLVSFARLPFETAYAIVAWSAWVPNLMVCECWLHLGRKRVLGRKLPIAHNV